MDICHGFSGFSDTWLFGDTIQVTWTLWTVMRAGGYALSRAREPEVICDLVTLEGVVLDPV